MTYEDIAKEIAGMTPEQRLQQAGMQTEENAFIGIVAIGVVYDPEEDTAQLVFVAEGGD